MRILYLLNWNIDSESGVLSKVSDQAKQWEVAGHEVHVWIVSHNTDAAFVPKAIKNLKVFDYQVNPVFVIGAIQHMVAKGAAFRTVKRELETLNPEVIYFRQCSWFPNLTGILASRPSIMELNSDDVAEISRQSFGRRAVYLWGRTRIIQAVTGFLAVSEEIGELYRPYRKPTKVLANGIDLTRLPVPHKEPVDRPNVVFVGSPDMAWHGTDKFLRMAELLPEFRFHLIGPSFSDAVPENVVQHGYLKKPDLYRLYPSMSIGIGSLAIHRNNVYEASPLKVREYIGFGLPVILAFKDTDLYADSESVLTLPNTEDNVETSVASIRDFIRTHADRLVPEATRLKVDATAKEQQRLAFFQEISTGSSRSRHSTARGAKS